MNILLQKPSYEKFILRAGRREDGGVDEDDTVGDGVDAGVAYVSELTCERVESNVEDAA
jgi:hypothetical protein